jgi:hypothetical protein
MATLTGSTIANSYKQLLQVGSNNTGLTGTVQTVQDGSGTNSGLQLSNSTVNINGTFQLNGVTLTANASTLNNLADLTGVVGLVAVSGGEVNGRTLTAGAGIAITNGDGTEGNPTIAVSLEDTTINVAKVSASIATFNSIVSAAFFVGDGAGLTNVPSTAGGTVKFIEAGTGIKITVNGAVSSSIPVSGTILVSADQNFGTVSVSTALAVTGDLLISGVTAATVNDVAAVSALTQTNLDSITSINTVVANVSALTSVNAAAITSINTVVDNLDFATSAELAAVSVLTQTNLDSITSINVVVANVSALTSINAAAITSINAVIEGNVSADSGTFNTLTVITSASIGGTLNVGGNVSIGGDLTAGATTLNDASTFKSNSGSVTRFAYDASGNLTLNNISNIYKDGAATSFLQIAGGSTTGAGGAAIFYGESHPTNASQIVLKSAGTIALTLDSSQNVGIGKSPSYARLEVSNGSGTTPSETTSGNTVALFQHNATTSDVAAISVIGGTSGQSALHFGDADDENRGMIQYDHGSDYMVLRTNGSGEDMRIDSSGNVGIGTSSPSAKLDVNGTLSAGATTVDSLTSTSSVLAQSATTPKLRLNNQGASGKDWQLTSFTDGVLYVGVNEVADYFTLSSTAATFAGDVTAGVNFNLPTTGRVEWDSGLWIRGTTATDTIDFITNGATALTLASDQSATFAGNVKLADARTLIFGNSTDMTIQHTSNNNYLDVNTGSLFIRDASDNNIVTFAQDQSSTFAGNVGIGTTSPVAQFESQAASGTLQTRTKVTGSTASDIAELAISTGTRTHLIQSKGSSGDFVIRDSTGATDRITMDTSGNVGIGTSSPAKQLHITKAAKADIGTLTDGATITPDFDANQNFSVTLGGNRTLANPSNIDAGQTGSIFVVQDGTGSRTLSFGSYWKFAGGTAPTLSTAAGAVDRIDYIVYTTTAIHAVATLNVS